MGGQIGYRWQRSVFVFGLEAQGNWADFRGDNVSVLNFNVRNQSKIDAFGLFSGQVGYAWNNVLLYVKGGAAVTNDKYTGVFIPSGLAFDSATETRWGGVVGVGLETASPRTGRSVLNTITCSWATAISAYAAPARILRVSHASNVSIRTSIWSPPASTTALAARSSRDIDPN